MRIIKAPPPDLATVLFNLGSRILVLVEGESDQRVFAEWYRDRLGNLMFHSPGGGVSGVQNRLQEVLDQGHHKRAYAIVDRDFRSDTEVEQHLADPNEHVLILRRYAIENYLLEPEAIQEELRVYENFQNRELPAVYAGMLDLCKQLSTRMAAHWVFFESGAAYFPEGHDLQDRDEFLPLVAKRLGCTLEDAELRIAAKEKLIAPLLATLETAHTCINGKHLLHQVHKRYFPRGIDKMYLFNQLIRTIGQMGLHADIKEIIETRILALDSDVRRE